MTKKIAFSWIYPLETTNGGIERVTRRLMEALEERGHSCLFLLHDQNRENYVCNGQVFPDLETFLKLKGIDVLVNQNGYSDAMTRALENTAWKGRYVVCYHNEPFFLRKLFDLRGVLKLVTDQTTNRTTRLSWLARLSVYPLWKWLSTRKIAAAQARNYQRADHYVVLSPTFLPQLRQLIGQRELPKATAIANPLSFDISPEEASQFEKQDFVLVVARLNDGEKRISAALAAWQIVERQNPHRWTLKIVGDGPDAALLKDIAKDMGLKHVTFIGSAAPLHYYQAASIFLMTSRVEGWGLTLTEAMQTGTVPIAFDAYASLRDIVDDGLTGIIVENGNVLALAWAILELMHSPERRAVMAAKGIEMMCKYHPDCLMDQWEAIL